MVNSRTKGEVSNNISACQAKVELGRESTFFAFLSTLVGLFCMTRKVIHAGKANNLGVCEDPYGEASSPHTV